MIDKSRGCGQGAVGPAQYTGVCPPRCGRGGLVSGGAWSVNSRPILPV